MGLDDALIFTRVVECHSFTQAAEISLFIREGTSSTQISSLQKILQADKDIARVTHISKQQALAEFGAVSGFGAALNYLTDNPLPDVLLVLPKNTGADSARQLLERLSKERIVEFGKLDIDWLTRLDAIVSLLRQAVLVIALLLLGAVLLSARTAKGSGPCSRARRTSCGPSCSP